MQNLTDPRPVCGQSGSTLTDNDLAALREAVELPTAVVHRHPLQMTGQMVTVLAAIRRNVAVLTGLLGGAA